MNEIFRVKKKKAGKGSLTFYFLFIIYGYFYLCVYKNKKHPILVNYNSALSPASRHFLDGS